MILGLVSKYSRSARHVFFDEKINFRGAKFTFHDACLYRGDSFRIVGSLGMDGSDGQSVGGGFLASRWWSTHVITLSFVPWFCWVGPEVFSVRDFPGALNDVLVPELTL